MAGPFYFSGLDLGQLSDYSALVTLEQTTRPDPDNPGKSLNHFDVRHIHRWKLQTPYTQVVADLRDWFAGTVLRGSPLIVDRTGVGVAVVDMILGADVPADVRAYTITAGSKPGDGTVPKIDLVGVVMAALGTDRLRFARGLEYTATLTEELRAFRMKVTADRNETFAAWRERDHDDLVLALALALWYGERNAGSDHPFGYDTSPTAMNDAPGLHNNYRGGGGWYSRPENW